MDVVLEELKRLESNCRLCLNKSEENHFFDDHDTKAEILQAVPGLEVRLIDPRLEGIKLILMFSF